MPPRLLAGYGLQIGELFCARSRTEDLSIHLQFGLGDRCLPPRRRLCPGCRKGSVRSAKPRGERPAREPFLNAQARCANLHIRKAGQRRTPTAASAPPGERAGPPKSVAAGLPRAPEATGLASPARVSPCQVEAAFQRDDARAGLDGRSEPNPPHIGAATKEIQARSERSPGLLREQRRTKELTVLPSTLTSLDALCHAKRVSAQLAKDQVHVGKPPTCAAASRPNGRAPPPLSHRYRTLSC